MAEATIGHLIEEIREEGRQRRKDTKENTEQIVSLNKTFSDYFTMLKRQQLDELEAKRDAKSSGAGAGATAAIAPTDKKGGGFLGILAGILAIGTALVVGFVEGFINAARDIFKLLRIVTRKAFSPILRILRIDKFAALLRSRIAGFFGLGVDGKPTVNTSKLIKGILNPLKGFTYLAEGLRNVMQGLGNSIRGGIGNIQRAFVTLGKPFVQISDDISRTSNKVVASLRATFMGFNKFFKDITFLAQQLKSTVKVAEEVPKQAGVVSRFFSSLGQTFRALIEPLKGVFNIFRTIGRVVFFPLTIIMTIFDAINGFKEGIQEEGVLGGILGAIGGIFSGLIGMPLDLLKSAVGWIAGKLGFENFEEQLASFSFAEIIQDIFIGLANLLNRIVGFIKDSFGAVGSKIAGFFGFGESEPSAVNKRAQEAARPKVMTPKSDEVLTTDNFREMMDRPSMADQAKARAKAEGRTIAGFNEDNMARIAAEIDARRAAEKAAAPSIDASTNVNQNQNFFGDYAPATDDLDR